MHDQNFPKAFEWNKIEYILRKDIFTHLTILDQKYYRSIRTGDLMTRLSSDINLVRDAIGQGLLQGIRTIIVLLFSLIVMLLTDVQLALTVYILYIPMVIIFFVILKMSFYGIIILRVHYKLSLIY